jgi:membrane protease YdiL (CAAX protease family)
MSYGRRVILYSLFSLYVALISNQIGVWFGLVLLSRTAFLVFVEEFFFRWFAFKVLNPNLGFLSGMIISSALFSFAHWPISIISIIIFSFGICMYFIYYKYKSLELCVFVHTFYNFFVESLSATELRNFIIYDRAATSYVYLILSVSIFMSSVGIICSATLDILRAKNKDFSNR